MTAVKVATAPGVRRIPGDRQVSRRAWIPTALWCQFFLVEYLVAGSWRGHYSYRYNFISELGVRYCSDGSCSVSFPLLNISMVVLGIGIAVWARWLWRIPATRNGAVLLYIAAIGATISGACPTNVNWPLHSGAADTFFMFAPIGVLSLCVIEWHKLGSSRYLMLVASGLAVICLIVYLQSGRLQSGIGLVERGIVYPAIIAMIAGVWAVERAQRSGRRGGAHR